MWLVTWYGRHPPIRTSSPVRASNPNGLAPLTGKVRQTSPNRAVFHALPVRWPGLPYPTYFPPAPQPSLCPPCVGGGVSSSASVPTPPTLLGSTRDIKALQY